MNICQFNKILYKEDGKFINITDNKYQKLVDEYNCVNYYQLHKKIK